MIRTLYVTAIVGAVALGAPAFAADASFAFKTAYRDVTADPDGIWAADAFADGKASVFEYQLHSGGADLLVSQIWNEDCASSTCPTRLVKIESGRRTVLVDDMMRQVIPPNDPRFANQAKSGPQAEYAQNPFRLSADGKTLINGDFKFELTGGKP